jgi:hypothetical protein
MTRSIAVLRPAAHPKAQYILAAAGDECGEVYFDDSDLFTGFASKVRSEDACKVVRETTIDHEIGTYRLPGPYLIIAYMRADLALSTCPSRIGASSILRSGRLTFSLCVSTAPSFS